MSLSDQPVGRIEKFEIEAVVVAEAFAEVQRGQVRGKIVLTF